MESQEQPPFEITHVEFELSATRPEHYPADALPQIAFAGRSNVGKSSLLNFFLVNKTMHFVDLPGYGFARAPQSVRSGWEKMITTFLTKSRQLRGVFALFDLRRELTEEDFALLEWLRHYQIAFVAVFTKADKLARSHQQNRLRQLREQLEPYAPVAVHLFSATTRQGRNELLETLQQLLVSKS